MSDELDEAERTRLTLKAQAQRLEELVANLEAELEEDENPATRRRLNVAAEKLAAVNAELAPLMARRANQLFEDFQRAVNGTLEEQLASLRHVWRKYRHPRVADLIDCLSTELAATLRGELLEADRRAQSGRAAADHGRAAVASERGGRQHEECEK